MVKKFVLNADGVGISKAINLGVLEAYGTGFLKSISIAANGKYFDEAIKTILPQCPDLGVGVHLNITSGKSLCSDLTTLTDSKSEFNNTYLKLLFLAYNLKNQDFFPQLEREFRRQIETVMSKTKVDHIDSNAHIHAIPSVFDLVCKLAKEYQINQVRTHFERLYFIPEIYKNMNFIFYKNFLKKLFLNCCSIINENTAHKYKLKTNDYILGISYGEKMESLAISYGVRGIKYDNVTVEASIHPCRYEDGKIDNHFDEYIIARNKKLADIIKRLGYDITNYAEKNENIS